jgi:hypothetical protein
MPRHLALVLAAACLLAGSVLPVAVQAQVTPAPPTDTARTPAQRALDRLRSLGGVGQADTLRQPVDTVQAEQVNIVVPGAAGAATARPATAPPSQIQRDSIMNALLAGIPSYIATEYQGDTVRFQAEGGRLELRGSPQVAREGNQLVADSLIVYDERTARACGYGSPVLHATAMTHPLASDTVCFDVQRQVGWARGAQTTFSEGATWNLRGETLVVDGNDYYSHRAIFTDCDLPWPHQHYHFGARSVKVVRDNVLVARDVTLNFQDVPVFWLPFMVQSLSQGRRSGLLMPRFGINDIVRQGTRYSRRIEDVGFYWAVNEYMGAEMALDWVSDNWTGLRGSFDYNFADRFLNGRLTYRQFWKQEGGREFTLASSNSWQMDERTNVSLTANYTTSSAFVRQRSIDPRELNRSIDSYGSLRRRFDFGNLSLGASRRQYLSDNTVTMQLPSASFNFVPVTLFSAEPGQERWYSNATWNGSTDLRVDRFMVGDNSPNRQAQDRQQFTTNASSGFTVGRFSWSQSFGFDEQRRDARTVLPDPTLAAQDTLFLPDALDQRGRWSTSLNFQQRLIGTSTFTPGLALGGEFVRNERSENQLVSSPTRIDFNASLNTELYGFWPGFAGFERFRHRLSPTISYSYSPAVRANPQQRAVFAIDTLVGLRERNRIMIGLSQTFEGRRRAEVTADTTAADTVQAGTPGEPRRRTQVQPIKLLSLSTSALVYDFIRAREIGQGLETTQIASSVQSDLIRGLQLSFAHDLFETTPLERTTLLAGPYQLRNTGLQQATTDRRFAPHLSSVNASFSLNSSSWLFRLLRLGVGEPETGGADPLQPEDPLGAGPALDHTEAEFGMVGTSRRVAQRGPRSAVGTWNANFTYSLSRPRSSIVGARENQMMTTGLTFQATENWGVRWDTSYSFTTSRFADHILTLTRTLHDWDANFDFVRAQNGNFQFQFRVHLRANPDIKFDYHQSDSPAVRQAQGQL